MNKEREVQFPSSAVLGPRKIKPQARKRELIRERKRLNPGISKFGWFTIGFYSLAICISIILFYYNFGSINQRVFLLLWSIFGIVNSIVFLKDKRR